MGLHLESGNIGAWIKRGNTYFKTGQYDQAIRDYDEALRLAPDDTGAREAREEAYRLKNR